jgi:SAM-dependent methyltransferase
LSALLAAALCLRIFAMQDDFYLRLEERFRGAPEEIKQRLRAYLPTTAQVQAFYPQGLAIDVGCGRGEWLELMQEQGFEILGIDTNADMVAVCQQKGLSAECADAFERLATFESDSVAIVSGFHIAEHLPFDMLMALMKEANRVLKPGGLLILETPNPENLNVGLWTFYMDPTHRHPIPPLLLQFLGEEAGFAHNHIIKLNGPESPEAGSPPLARVAWSLSAHPDCGLIAQKQTTEQQDALLGHLTRNDLAQPLQQINIELEQLQQEWEQVHEEKRTLEARLTSEKEQLVAEKNALQEGLEAEVASAKKQNLMMEGYYHSARSELHHLQSRFHEFEGNAHNVYQELLATRASFSWRITRPLRLGSRLICKGPGKAKKVLLKSLRLAFNVVIKIPGVQPLGQKMLDRAPGLRRLKNKLQGQSAPEGEPGYLRPEYPNEQRRRIVRDVSQRLGEHPAKPQEGDQ